MKKVTSIAVTLLISSLTIAAQQLKDKDIPTVVKETFKKNYSNINELKWEKEGENFEVNFEIDELEQSVVMDASGHILETEKEMDIARLPEAVKRYVAQNYSSAKIKEAALITDANGATNYEVEIKGKDLIFDDQGKFLKESTN